eukprot:UN17220
MRKSIALIAFVLLCTAVFAASTHDEEEPALAETSRTQRVRCWNRPYRRLCRWYNHYYNVNICRYHRVRRRRRHCIYRRRRLCKLVRRHHYIRRCRKIRHRRRRQHCYNQRYRYCRWLYRNHR